MRWRNCEVPTLEGTDSPVQAEVLELVDRDDVALKRFTKELDGSLTEESVTVTPAVARVVRATLDTALSDDGSVLQFGGLTITEDVEIAGDDDGTELAAHLAANLEKIPAESFTDNNDQTYDITMRPGVNTLAFSSGDAQLTFSEVTAGVDAVSSMGVPYVPANLSTLDPAAAVSATDSFAVTQNVMVVAGADAGDVAGSCTYRGQNNGRGLYVLDGEATAVDTYAFAWDGVDTWFGYDGNGDEFIYATEDVATPADVIAWLLVSDDSTADVTVTATPTTFSVTPSQVVGLLKGYVADDVVYNDNANLGEVPGMSVTVETGGIYKVEVEAYSTNAVKALMCDFAGTVTPTNFVGQWIAIDSEMDIGGGSTGIGQRVTAIGSDFAPSQLDGTSNSTYRFSGSLKVTTGGTFLLRAAQNVADMSDTTLLSGSNMVLTKMN